MIYGRTPGQCRNVVHRHWTLTCCRGRPAHGHTIAYVIEHRSDEVLQVEHGSLYPALHRLQERGWISSQWGPSENNRKARFYRLTAAGRKQLSKQTSRWAELVAAVNRVLKPSGSRP